MTKNDPVQLLINDGIATMTLNDPTKLNALSIPLIDNFMSITEQLRKNKSIRVLRITGTGKGFFSRC
jgi:enoyl-CoA hydratase/carnithine racemase